MESFNTSNTTIASFASFASTSATATATATILVEVVLAVRDGIGRDGGVGNGALREAVNAFRSEFACDGWKVSVRLPGAGVWEIETWSYYSTEKTTIRHDGRLFVTISVLKDGTIGMGWHNQSTQLPALREWRRAAQKNYDHLRAQVEQVIKAGGAVYYRPGQKGGSFSLTLGGDRVAALPLLKSMGLEVAHDMGRYDSPTRWVVLCTAPRMGRRQLRDWRSFELAQL